MFETVGANTAKLEIRPESNLFTLLPGHSLRVQISLANLTTLPDNYELQVEGFPEGWFSLEQTTFYLFPRWDATTQLNLEIPETALPQDYEVILRLAAQNEKDVFEQTTIIIKVKAAEAIRPATPTGLAEATPKIQAVTDKTTLNTKPAKTTAKTRLPENEPGDIAWLKNPTAKISEDEKKPVASNGNTGRIFRAHTTRLDALPKVPLYSPQVTGPETRSNGPWQAPEPYESVEWPAPILSYDGPAVGLKVESSELVIPAGRSFEQQVTLTNLTGEHKQFEVAVVGLPVEWIHFSSAFFNLHPERAEQFYMRIGIPSDVAPGRYRGKIQAQPVETEALPTELTLVVDVKEALSSLVAEPLSENGVVELTIENAHIALAPGEVYEQDVTLINHSNFADNFELTLEGLPTEWFTLSSQSFYLFPKWKEQSSFRLEIPVGVEAGLYNARLVLASHNRSELQSFQNFEVEVRQATAMLYEKRPTRKLAGVVVAELPTTEPETTEPAAQVTESSTSAPAGNWLLQGLGIAADQTAEKEETPEIGEVETVKPSQTAELSVQPEVANITNIIEESEKTTPVAANNTTNISNINIIEETNEVSPEVVATEPIIGNKETRKIPASETPAPIIPAPLSLENSTAEAQVQQAATEIVVQDSKETAKMKESEPDNVRLFAVAAEPQVDVGTEISAPPALDGNKKTAKMKNDGPEIPWLFAPVVISEPETQLIEPENPVRPALDGNKETAKMKEQPAENLFAPVPLKTETTTPPQPETSQPEKAPALIPWVVAPLAVVTLAEMSGNSTPVIFDPTAPSIPEIVLAGEKSTAKMQPSDEPAPLFAPVPLVATVETETPGKANAEETLPASEENPVIEDVPTVKPGSRLLELAVAQVEAEDAAALAESNAPEKVASENTEATTTENDPMLAMLFPTAAKKLDIDKEDKDKENVGAKPTEEEKEPELAEQLDPDKMMAMLFHMPQAAPAVAATAEPQVPVVTTPAPSEESGLPTTSTGEIEIQMASPKLNILPGYKAQYAITIVNNSKTSGNFEISVDQLPARFATISNNTTYLMPGWSDTVTLSLNVPSNATDATHRGKILVKCSEEPTLTGVLDVSLRVGAPEPETENAISSGKRPTAKLAGIVPVVTNQRTLTEEEKRAITSGKRATAKLGSVLSTLQVPTAGQPAHPHQNNEVAPQVQLFNTQPKPDKQKNAPPPRNPIVTEQPSQAPAKKESGFGKLFGGKKKTPQAQAAPVAGSVANPVRSAVVAPPPGAPRPTGDNPLAPNAPTARPAHTATKPRKINSDVPHIEIELEKIHLTIVAGTNYDNLKITLANRTPLPDDFDLSIEGLPSTWFHFEEGKNAVNMFPNQTGETEVTIKIPPKVRPSLYVGQVVVRARTQPGIIADARLEIQVYSPLTVQGRLSPTRARGYKADYNLILRNSSMSQATMRFSLAPENPHCVATFNPAEVIIPGGQSANVAVKVGIAPKTASDYKQQEQSFEIIVSPEWEVGEDKKKTGEIRVEGTYYYESIFTFFKRHPKLTTFLVITILGFIVWQLFILPSIQAGSLFYASQSSIFPRPVVNNSIRIEQQGLADGVQKYNPFNAISTFEIKFEEEPESVEISKSVRLGQSLEAPIQYKGRVVNEFRVYFLKFELKGRLALNKKTSDIFFVADNPNEANGFPWVFAPPDRMWEEYNKKLRNWRLNLQNPQLFVNFVEVEGNTLYLRMERCQPNTEVCGGAGAQRIIGK